MTPPGTSSFKPDGIGSSTKKILTCWRLDRLTRPDVNLFPPKLDEGLNGHRMVVSAAEQPPFVIKKNLAADEVVENVHKGVADVGVSGIYTSRQFYNYIYFSSSHSQDCAAFITSSSTAIPKSVKRTYWIFTIIITAAYSSSIISFITIPTYFDVVDTVDDLIEEEFRVGTIDSRDWKEGFIDTMDNKTNELLKNIEIVNSSIIGLEKVRKQKNFAFLGSRSYLSYAVRSNFSFSSSKKKSMYHITSQCLAPFMVSFVMKPKADFLIKFDQQIQRLQENGLIEKIANDIDWAINRKIGGRLFMGASTGLKNDAPEDRQLTLDDVQGMFLLLGIGMNFAAASLIRECWYGYRCCRPSRILTSRRSSIPSIEITPCSTDEDDTFAQKIVAYCERAVSAGISAGKERLSMSIRPFSH
ncbi:hypothetical protein V9T40_003161 [Parthenolecanium corni]|uniref:Ionotropic glutamate receptor C-terminal domain-containing protein n=1 Tax=Parthenolecanium corni TaxID=536013 RepID=A0AAN9TSM7_9HEMI